MRLPKRGIAPFVGRQRFKCIYETFAKALSKTTILKTLKDLKDVEWKTHVDRMKKPAWAKGRYTNADTRMKLLSFPPVVDIVAPGVGTVDRVTLTAQLTNRKIGLVLKLTPEVLTYLRAVVTVQLRIVLGSTVSDLQPDDDRVDTGIKDLFWNRRKRKFRAVFRPPLENGVKPGRQEFLTDCRENAIAFTRTGRRPVVGMNASDEAIPSDDDDRSDPEPSEAEDQDEAATPSHDDRATA